MPWRLVQAKRAERDLAGLPLETRTSILRALERLIVNPSSVDLAKLAGRRNEWRLRVGAYRAILDFDNQAGTVTVVRVLPRGRAYGS
jgi:mRNA-degrading endonuclease RelE of RelBE toxin-antitoxin system